MPKFILAALVAMVSVTPYYAAANQVVDTLSDLKVTVTVQEEPFTGPAFQLFATDDCSAFATQRHPIDIMMGQQRPPVKQAPKPPPPPLPKKSEEGGLLEDLDLADQVLDGMIKIGAKIWKIIEANKPVVNVETKVAHALPFNVKCWMDLENWQMPKSYKYNVKYTNLFGIDVVNFTFRVLYTYGATYDGHGQYLSNVSIHPAELDVAWGYTFNSKVETGRLINLGTKLDPVAGMELKLNWQIATPLKDSQSSEIFFVTGRGEIQRN